MKKRAQHPDAYTFTLIFRGLAKNAHLRLEGTVQAALKVFDSMLNEDSPVKPSSIHVNAMLNACAQAFDIDTMFSVAARFPESGSSALDHVAFTTILQSLLKNALRRVPDTDQRQILERKQRAIVQGRRIWGDVRNRWSKNSIQMDERLVCAMGRLLLVGDGIDNDDVLSLLEQTMHIERLVPRLGDPERPSRLQGAEKRLKNLHAAIDGSQPEFEDVSDEIEENESYDTGVSNTKNLTTIEHTNSPEFRPLPFARNSARLVPVPGPNTLSLVLNACAQMGAFSEGQKYWDQITQTVEPDQENYHSYLRNLRAMRAGGRAVDLVADMARTKENGGLGVGVALKTFRIAMSACVRNHLSVQTLKTATRLLTLMQSSLEVPDSDTMMIFLELFQKKYVRWPVQDVVNAADTLFDIFRNLRGLNAFGGDPQDLPSNARSPREPDESEDTMEAIDPVSEDWSDTHARVAARVSIMPEDLVARGHIDAETRAVLKSVGRRLETEYTNMLRLYDTDLARPEHRRISSYRFRVRDWVFRRRHRSEEGLGMRWKQSVRDRARMGATVFRRETEEDQRVEEEPGQQRAGFA
ncbi:hypothetical protein MMC10_007185 [Thelotrema lepadinum]|nr:hypothetical protein [Thelotrema lepadinum]